MTRALVLSVSRTCCSLERRGEDEMILTLLVFSGRFLSNSQLQKVYLVSLTMLLLCRSVVLRYFVESLPIVSTDCSMSVSVDLIPRRGFGLVDFPVAECLSLVRSIDIVPVIAESSADRYRNALAQFVTIDSLISTLRWSPDRWDNSVPRFDYVRWYAHFPIEYVRHRQSNEHFPREDNCRKESNSREWSSHKCLVLIHRQDGIPRFIHRRIICHGRGDQFTFSSSQMCW